MDIPYRERGYSIEAETGVVHERYQEHARTARRTSALGVSNVLNGREAIACEVCFPKPRERKPKAGSALNAGPAEREAASAEFRAAEPYLIGEHGPETFVFQPHPDAITEVDSKPPDGESA